MQRHPLRNADYDTLRLQTQTVRICTSGLAPTDSPFCCSVGDTDRKAATEAVIDVTWGSAREFALCR